jgi:hypothetical protein
VVRGKEPEGIVLTTDNEQLTSDNQQKGLSAARIEAASG